MSLNLDKIERETAAAGKNSPAGIMRSQTNILLAEIKRLRAGEDTRLLDKLLSDINGCDDNPIRNIFGDVDGEGELDRDWIRAQIAADGE